MPLVCIGINHRTAPVAVRERLAFTEADHREALTAPALRDAAQPAGLTEFALLSTCNRTELYAAGDASRRVPPLPDDPPGLLAALRGLAADPFRDQVYAHRGLDAVRHLCRVAAGLDSMVPGESEVLGQVAASHELGVQERAVGPVLGAAFRTAVRAGRRARTETGICRNPASVSSEAVRLVRESGRDLARARVLIIGTGQMARLAGEALRGHGARDLLVVSRTAGHAERMAGALRALPLAWHELERAIRDADIIVSSTGAPHAVVTLELVASARAGGTRPLLIMDIAVPRDVEPAVRSLPGVAVYDLDDLQARLNGNLEERRREIPRVEDIVEQEVARFESWRHGAELRPLLGEMRARSEAIRRREVERALRRLGPVPDELRAHFDAFSQSLVNKLLHEPTRRLREETDPDRCDTYSRVTRDLFGLRPRPEASCE